MTQINIGININADANAKIQGNIICGKKYYIWNRTTCNCENGKYFGSIIDHIIR